MITGLIISAIYWSMAYACALYYQKNAPNKLLGIWPRLSFSIIVWLVVFFIQLFVKEYIFQIPRDRIGPPVSTGPALFSALIFYYYSGHRIKDGKVGKVTPTPEFSSSSTDADKDSPSASSNYSDPVSNTALNRNSDSRKALVGWVLVVTIAVILIYSRVQGHTDRTSSGAPATVVVSPADQAITPQDEKKYYVCITDRANSRVSYTITFANGQTSKQELAPGQGFIHYSPQESDATLTFFAFATHERNIKMRLRDEGDGNCSKNGYIFQNLPGLSPDTPSFDFDLYSQ